MRIPDASTGEAVYSVLPMRAEGLEPPRLSPPAPKAGVSTSSTTPAGESILGSPARPHSRYGRAEAGFVRRTGSPIRHGYDSASRGHWPNWIRHRSPKPAIPGSSPGCPVASVEPYPAAGAGLRPASPEAGYPAGDRWKPLE